jgi:hypothetical protein
MPPKKRTKRPEDVISELEGKFGSTSRKFEALKVAFCQRRILNRNDKESLMLLQLDKERLETHLVELEKDFFDFYDSMNTQYKILQKFTILKVKGLEDQLHLARKKLHDTETDLKGIIDKRTKTIEEKQNRIQNLEMHVSRIHINMEMVLQKTLSDLEKKLSRDCETWQLEGLSLHEDTKTCLVEHDLNVNEI